MRIANLAGRSVLLTGDGAVDVATGGFDADPAALFGQWDALRDWSAGVDPSAAVPYKESDLLAPVPEPRQIFAVALNYRPHTAEAGYEEPAEPLVFTKFPSCLTGPYTTIDVPPGHVDWELETVAVIGHEAYRVPEEHGWDPVVAVTVGQDLSERITQLAGRPAQFSLGKSFPGFGPVGPALVSTDELADRDDLELTCELNGETVQHDRTSNMIFPVPRLVAHLSAICPLRPGDLIFTGTPAGVGNRRTPQRFIGPGDTLVSRIGGLGEMRHTFRSAP
ncbi:fumarylacetoacetate hydrolase family protein [Streptomyces sp. NBC_00670]|jgi:2-keto-4-pentenoate hydratase/2-oxohepta-3-ene-1,7-dioic acid hydratase in catechol pathway|uniref:fumarylacetoacetate hydrolase family protein n=1 Tax=Streptomyces sp. NBC_00670 TaxID=2975804 RepID=UPI002E34F31D|nr:fumarylacetoacetate hydrolase family protein [Streptomyces sp. NBC_00670]